MHCATFQYASALFLAAVAMGLPFLPAFPKKQKKQLSLFLHGEAKPVDAFEVNNEFSCMLSGLGFDAKVAHDFASKASRGLLTYTQQSLLNFFKAHPYQFEVMMDNISFFTEAFFISIANSNQFGNNFYHCSKKPVSAMVFTRCGNCAKK